MTERVEPMGEMDIEYLVAVVRDHARLVADLEAHRSLSRNQIEQWQHERDALRVELARIRAHIESSHNEVTCSQDARHANDGDDRVPMLTCMTLEAHTLRAENAKLRDQLDAANARIGRLRNALSDMVTWTEGVPLHPGDMLIFARQSALAALAALDEEPRHD